MNIHLITYLTSKLFWIYIVFRYNTILYPQNEDTQKLFAYFCAYLLSCWGSMQWGTMYGDLIFELIALLIITVAYQADWQHHVWNTLMVYIMGILCDGIPIVFFQRYAVARNPVQMLAEAEITERKPYETYRSGADANQWKRAPFHRNSGRETSSNLYSF